MQSDLTGPWYAVFSSRFDTITHTPISIGYAHTNLGDISGSRAINRIALSGAVDATTWYRFGLHIPNASTSGYFHIQLRHSGQNSAGTTNIDNVYILAEL